MVAYATKESNSLLPGHNDSEHRPHLVESFSPFEAQF
jgi:hypothetical protein